MYEEIVKQLQEIFGKDLKYKVQEINYPLEGAGKPATPMISIVVDDSTKAAAKLKADRLADVLRNEYFKSYTVKVNGSKAGVTCSYVVVYQLQPQAQEIQEKAHELETKQKDIIERLHNMEQTSQIQLPLSNGGVSSSADDSLKKALLERIIPAVCKMLSEHAGNQIEEEESTVDSRCFKSIKLYKGCKVVGEYIPGSVGISAKICIIYGATDFNSAILPIINCFLGNFKVKQGCIVEQARGVGRKELYLEIQPFACGKDSRTEGSFSGLIDDSKKWVDFLRLLEEQRSQLAQKLSKFDVNQFLALPSSASSSTVAVTQDPPSVAQVLPDSSSVAPTLFKPSKDSTGGSDTKQGSTDAKKPDGNCVIL